MISEGTVYFRREEGLWRVAIQKIVAYSVICVGAGYYSIGRGYESM